MANSLNAKKRIRQNIKSRSRNRWRRETFRAAIREYREAILHASNEEAKKQLDNIYKLLDKSAAKGAIHARTAARYKSRLTGRFNKKLAG